MEFEWDEDKRRRNIERHGYDFLDGVLVFAGEYYVATRRRRGKKDGLPSGASAASSLLWCSRSEASVTRSRGSSA
jgi:hypothetical protein